MQTLAVIGDPIKHSLSPIMHNAALKNLKLEEKYIFKPIHVRSQDLEKFINEVRTKDIKGFNVTLPHKSKIMPFLDRVDESANSIGAVNTVVNNSGALTGYNTDFQGFISSLINNDIEISNRRFLLLGAGGAALSVAYGILCEGARVYVKNRTKDRAKSLVSKFIDYGPIKVIQNIDFSKIDCIVNTTSVGMDGKSSPIKTNQINKNHVVIDIIYSPIYTSLLKESKSNGAKILNGIEMLIHQGALSFKHFTSYDPSIDIMRNSLKKYII